MYPNANIECHLCLQNLTKWVPITQVIHDRIIGPYSMKYLSNYLSMEAAKLYHNKPGKSVNSGIVTDFHLVWLTY